MSVSSQTSGSPTNETEGMKDKAVSAVQSFGEGVKEKASGIAEAAKDAAKDAGAQLQSAAEERKQAGADFGTEVAASLRRAAGELDGQIPQVGDYVRKAADQIDQASDALKRRDFSELIAGVQDFARRQPTAFLGATVLAGFLAVRFFKSAAPAPSVGPPKNQDGAAGSSPASYGA